MAIPFATVYGIGIDLAQVDIASTSGYEQDINKISFKVGTTVIASDSTVWCYCLVNTGGVTGLGYVVTIDEDHLATMMANSVGAYGDRIGVAPAASLVGNYGWFQVYGVCDAIQVTAAAAANVPLASTTTAGQIDDSVANPTKNITGIVLTTLRGGTDGTAPGFLNWPVVGTTN